MFRTLAAIGLLYAAFRYGEQRAQINQHDYLLTKRVNLSGGTTIEEYLQIDNQGNLQFVQDMNLATPLLFSHAKELQSVIRRHSPGIPLALVTLNQQLTQAQPI